MIARSRAARRRQIRTQAAFILAGTACAVAMALLSIGLLVVPWAS